MEIVLASVVLSLVIVGTYACSCMPTHPSNSFCSAAVAVEVFVEDYTEIYYDIGQGKLTGVPDNVIYNMTVKEVFRTNPRYSDIAVGNTLLMSAGGNENLCGILLSKKTSYFIAAETRYDGGLGFSLCSWTSPMSELTEVELDGVRGGYDCENVSASESLYRKRKVSSQRGFFTAVNRRKISGKAFSTL